MTAEAVDAIDVEGRDRADHRDLSDRGWAQSAKSELLSFQACSLDELPDGFSFGSGPLCRW